MSSLLIHGGTYLVGSSDTMNPLRGEELAQITLLEDGYLLAEDGVIQSLGPSSESPLRADHVIDARGKYVLPCWCDSHSHIVFAASREQEFVQRIQGMSYEQIAANGGGILNSARRLREMPEAVLYDHASQRLRQMISMGTGALEIKSGYGLNVESEFKMLKVIRRLKEDFPIPIRATFLGAHAVPLEYKSNRAGYLDLLIDEMIPALVGEGLADFIDVFCDRGFFAIEESERIIEAGARHGLKAKIHVSQLANIGGVQLGVRQQALSVDHLECAGTEEIAALSRSSTIATLLPSCPFFLDLEYAPARGLIDAGAAVALATDYNPGSTPSGNMPFVISLACLKMKMSPEEAINAATINGAHAMEVAYEAGALSPGKLANVIITMSIPSLAYLPYSFGSNHIDKVLIRSMEYGHLPV